jgi:hypothetical protein
MQRAEGILVAKCEIAPGYAARWIDQESSKTGRSKSAVANQLIAIYQPALLTSEGAAGGLLMSYR